MILSAGYRLWIGEATTSDRFADGAAEVRRLRRLRQVADAVDAYGVLLCTSAAAFSERTVGRATAELTLWGREPEYLVGVPTASAMSW